MKVYIWYPACVSTESEFIYDMHVVVDGKIRSFMIKSELNFKADPREIFLADEDMFSIEEFTGYPGFDTSRLFGSKRKLKRYMHGAGLYELKPKHREWDAAMMVLAKAGL